MKFETHDTFLFSSKRLAEITGFDTAKTHNRVAKLVVLKPHLYSDATCVLIHLYSAKNGEEEEGERVLVKHYDLENMIVSFRGTKYGVSL